jgi:hypothetical protein
LRTLSIARWSAIAIFLMGVGGCATIRTTDPARTATEQFLLTGAASRAAEQLSVDALRDRIVFVDTTTITPGAQTQEVTYLIAEVRAKLLASGVRLTGARDKAEVVLEVRSGGIGIDRLEFLLGIPAVYVGNATAAAGAPNIPASTPELALLKSTRQRGFASVAFVAYWANSGELIAMSGPFVGRTLREDFWFFGVGPKTVGNVAPAERPK